MVITMTDETNAGASTEVTSENVSVDGGTTTASVASTDFLSSLKDETNKEWVSSKGYKELDPLISSARHAEKLQSELNDYKSKAILPLSDNATEEEQKAYYQKLGVPDEAAGYEFQMPEGTADDLPYDKGFADQFKVWSKEANLTPKQAQALHDAYVKNTEAAIKAAQEKQVEAIKGEMQAAFVELTQAWGTQGSPNFDKQIGYAVRALDNSGIKDDLIKSGLIDAEGNARSAKVAKFLALAGQHLYTEDRTIVGGHTIDGNPFATGNLTQQMLIARNDPNRAKALIAAAGKRPSDFGLSN